MNAKLSEELMNALDANGDELEFVDPRTNRVYVLVGQETLLRARAALERQQQEDMSAIQQGINDMEAGRTVSIGEAHERIREQLVSRYGE